MTHAGPTRRDPFQHQIVADERAPAARTASRSASSRQRGRVTSREVACIQRPDVIITKTHIPRRTVLRGLGATWRCRGSMQLTMLQRLNLQVERFGNSTGITVARLS